MKKDNVRNLFKSFVERFKSLSKNSQPKKMVGMLVAGIACVATVVAACAVLLIVKPASTLTSDTPYYSKLDGHYADVDNFNVVVEDGIGPFDTNTDPNAPDYYLRPGNDSSDSNGIVRSYDTIFYQLNYTTVLKESGKEVEEGFIWYESTLPCSSEQATFDVKDGKTAWVGKQCGSLSELESLDKGGYILTEENGKQHLIGKVRLLPLKGNPAAIPGEGSLYLAVSVLKMYQDETINPEFSVWLDHSDVKKSATPKAVTVTSQLRINIQLRPVNTNYMSGTVDTFDFTTGNALAVDKGAGKVYGVIRGYGITIQMHNDNNADGRNLKGCEMPHGDISFDLNLKDVIYTKRDNDGTDITLFAGDGSDTDYTFKPLIWSYDIHKTTTTSKGPDGSVIVNNSPQDGRAIHKYTWAGYVPGAAPFAYRYGYTAEYTFVRGKNNVFCSGGGAWTADRIDNNTVNFTIKDYYPREKGKEDGKSLTDFVSYPSDDAGATTSDRYDYFNPMDYDYENPLGSISTACFTAAKLYVVVPISDENGTIYEQYGQGTLNWNISIDQKSLKVASQNAPKIDTDTVETDESGNTIKYRKQTKLSDDTAGASYSPNPKGTYATNVRYTSTKIPGLDIQANSLWVSNGLDIAPIGQNNVAAEWGFVGSQIEGDYAIYAANSLLKIDDKAFIIEPKASNPRKGLNDNQLLYSDTVSYTYLYAFKENGEGWLNDTEMNNARTEDLVYCTADEFYEWKNAGKTCVGILLEYRETKPPTGIDLVKINVMANLKMKDGKEDYERLVGNTYQILTYTTIWNGACLDDTTVLPASLATQKDKDSKVKLPKGILLNCDENGLPKHYNKTTYDENDNPVTWHSGEVLLGDSVHIVGYRTTVEKTVTDTYDDGSVKRTFNLNDKERTVNYKISPAIKYGADNVENLNYEQTATVRVVDTIPKGLDCVRDEKNALIYTVEWEYPEDEYDGIECKLVSDGADEDGNTVLTWIFTGVKVGKEMPEIKYACNISERPDLVKVGDVFTNTVEIAPLVNGEPVGFPINVKHKNIATESIKITGLAQISFSKFADKPVYGAKYADDPLTWTMYVGNNSNAPYIDDVWLDVLPYNGDGNGSVFGFSQRVVEWTLDGTNAPKTFETWEAYYTTNVDVRTTNASAYKADEIRNGESGGIRWEELRLAYDGYIVTVENIPQRGDLPTAFVIVGNLEEGEIYKSKLAIENTDSEPSETLVNRLSRKDANVTGKVEIVTRSISGLVWWDKDFDGIQDKDEEVIEKGIKITLLKLNKNGKYEPYEVDGKAMSVEPGKQQSGITGKTSSIEDGKYEFTDLPAGTYTVRFEAESGNDEFEVWSASPKNANNNESDEKDSDATPTYDTNKKLLKTEITDIVLPLIDYSADGSESGYLKKEHNDSGLYAYTQDLRIKKIDESIKTAIEGAEFTLYTAEVDSNGEWTTVDGKFITNVKELLGIYTTAVSDENGIVLLEGIEPGHYIMRETKAAAGYYLPDTYWKLTVGHNGELILADEQGNILEADDDNNYVITNKAGAELPLTGGNGTKIFYAVGVLLVGASVGFALTYQRKRRYV